MYLFSHLSIARLHKMSAQKAWANWPLSLKQTENRTDPTLFPEYKALHDREFLSNMAKDIRMNAVNALRVAYKKHYNVDSTEGVAVVVMGGQSQDWELYCSDTDKAVFRQESFFMHLFQCNEPDLFGVIDLSTDGKSALGLPYLPSAAVRWNGEQKPLSAYLDEYRVDDAFICSDAEGSTAPVAEYLKSKKITTILTLYGQNTDSGLWTKTTAKFDGMEAFVVDKSPQLLHKELSLLQSIKTDLEIEYLRRCCNMSARAHAFVMANIKPCMTELQCEALFTAYCAYYGGSRAMAYTCICGSGPNGAILHHGHAAHPNCRLLEENDMIVLDMGGEYNGYATDLTRTYPVSGKFTSTQAEIFNIVRKAQLAVYDEIKPGAFWPDLHRLSEKVIIEGLLELGIFKTDVDNCIKNYMGSLVCPHGLGHLLGLNVHGVGGYIDCPPKCTEPGVCWLRLGRKLEKGMVVTVEPGIYFNKPWITEQLAKNPNMAECVNMEKLEQYWNFGGVRLEDDIAVTETGFEMLTGEWPSTVEDIESVCATFNQ